MVGTNQSHIPLQPHCIITFFPSNVAIILEELEDVLKSALKDVWLKWDYSVCLIITIHSSKVWNMDYVGGSSIKLVQDLIE